MPGGDGSVTASNPGTPPPAPRSTIRPGWGRDGGITSHQVRAGLRYKLGGCDRPVEVVYQPEPLPVYK